MFNKRRERKVAASTARDEHLQQLLELARTFTGFDAADVPDMHLRTTPDERIFVCLQDAFLIDAHTPRELHAAPIDRGEFVATNTRAVFTGAEEVRQWHWSSLVAVVHADDAPSTSIEVSNRHRALGVLYESRHQDEIRFGIDLAVADVRGDRDALIRRLGDELSALRAEHSLPVA